MSAEHDATELQNEVYRLEARVAELEAQLRAAREQEPVAYSITDGAHTIARMAKHVDPRRLTAVNVTPLYAAPVPPSQGEVPRWRCMDDAPDKTGRYIVAHAGMVGGDAYFTAKEGDTHYPVGWSQVPHWKPTHWLDCDRSTMLAAQTAGEGKV